MTHFELLDLAIHRGTALIVASTDENNWAELEARFAHSAHGVDLSFDHAFGTEHVWGVEIELYDVTHTVNQGEGFVDIDNEALYQFIYEALECEVCA